MTQDGDVHLKCFLSAGPTALKGFSNQRMSKQHKEMRGIGFAFQNNRVCVLLYNLLKNNNINLSVDYVSLGREEVGTLGKGQVELWEHWKKDSH